MATIWTMGEMLVEVMRPQPEMPLGVTGEFIGPFPSGAPAIFIDTVARLGHRGGIVGGVGPDDFGRCVLERLKADGVDCRHVQICPDGATAVAFVTYFRNGSRRFIFHLNGTPAARAQGLTATDVEELGRVDYFHIMGCSLMINPEFSQQIVHTMQQFRRTGAQVSFDPNIRPELLGGRAIQDVVGAVLPECRVLLPGLDELKLLTGVAQPDGAVDRLCDQTPIELVALKLGKRGCRVYQRDNDPVDVPAFQVGEVDPTGAGDCFDAGFLCGLMEGRLPVEAARVAAAAGALNAAAFGPMEGDVGPNTVYSLVDGDNR